jgi:uncharacterized protein (DUF2336 family)
VSTDQGQYAYQNPLSPVSETNARKLIDKLARAGELRASYLIRVLREGRMELFDHGFATLLQLDVEPMRRALYGASPHSVALACRAVGIDRAAFLTVFQLCRRQRQCGTVLSDSDQREIQAIFSQVPKGDALQRLRGQAA